MKENKFRSDEIDMVDFKDILWFMWYFENKIEIS